LVVSDLGGWLPWEAGYDDSVRIWQPALYEPESASGPLNSEVAADARV
jgi:hypothetical protein